MFDLTSDDITDGSLLRGLLVLSAPLLVQNVVQVIQQVIDLFWVGRLSNDAVAAVGLTVPLVSLLFAVAALVPFVGTQVLVSQRVGSENIFGARRGMFSGLVVAVGFGVVFGGLVFVAARPLIDLLLSTRPGSTTNSVTKLAVAYFGIIALGVWLTGISDTIEAAFIGWGDSQTALYMNVTALGVNLFLDPILIFGFRDSPLFEPLGLGLQSALFSVTQFSGIGIEGAALSNVIGYGVGGLLGLVLVARGRNGGMLSRTAARIDLNDIRELIDIGIPTGGQIFAKQIVELVLVLIVFDAAGAAGLAAYIVGFRVASIATTPSASLQQAAQSIVGQNLGAGLTNRARRVTWLGVGVAAGALALIGVVQWTIPRTLVQLFVPSLSAEATRLAVDYLGILAYGYPAIGAAYLFQAGFNGARRTRTSFVASLFQYWGVRFSIAAIGSIVLSFGMYAVFWSVSLSNLLAAIGLGGYYHYSTASGMFERAAETVAAD